MADGEEGTAYGLTAYAPSTSPETILLLDAVMIDVAKWIESAAGSFLGHVKMAVTAGGVTVTLNLTDITLGVEHHGSIPEGVRADIRFMAAVLDVKSGELGEKMRNSLISNGFKIKDKSIIELR